MKAEANSCANRKCDNIERGKKEAVSFLSHTFLGEPIADRYFHSSFGWVLQLISFDPFDRLDKHFSLNMNFLSTPLLLDKL